MTDQRCGTCFFRFEDQCRRYAPRPLYQLIPKGTQEEISNDNYDYDERTIFTWPLAPEGEWCGEWKDQQNA